MVDLLDEFGVRPGDCVAVVGAGGKTALCWRMVQALAARGERVVFTTTTKIWQPVAGAFDYFVIDPHPNPLPEGEGAWRTACIAAAIEGEPSDSPVPDATMPTVQTKLIGFAPDAICKLITPNVMSRDPRSDPRNEERDRGRHASLVVEADGARGLLLKAPADNEPAIPPCADVVCVVASLDAIGRPLDGHTVHRVERVARITGAPAGSMITAAMIVDVFCHAEGGMKNMPANAQRVAVLTQHHAGAPHPDATFMLAQLRERGYHHAVLCKE